MSDLLSSDEFAEIKSAVRDVTDTFYQEDVIYNAPGSDFDQNGIGMSEYNTTPTTINCRVSFMDDESDSEVQTNDGGRSDEQEVEFWFNTEYLSELGVSFDPLQGFFTYEGGRYSIKLIHNSDSDIKGDKLLTVVKCVKDKVAN